MSASPQERTSGLGLLQPSSGLRRPGHRYAAALERSGVAAVYTPKDFELNRIMSDVVRIVERANGASNV